jgi:hypothetical protein
MLGARCLAATNLIYEQDCRGIVCMHTYSSRWQDLNGCPRSLRRRWCAALLAGLLLHNLGVGSQDCLLGYYYLGEYSLVSASFVFAPGPSLRDVLLVLPLVFALGPRWRCYFEWLFYLWGRINDKQGSCRVTILLAGKKHHTRACKYVACVSSSSCCVETKT